jgi:predicted DsbA family dithiol-disulfide isomerase
MDRIKIEVFTSPTCPHCPGAVKATEKLLDENPELQDKVTWKELSTASPKGHSKAKTYGIRSVPTIVVTNSRGEKGAYAGAPTQRHYKDMIEKMSK